MPFDGSPAAAVALEIEELRASGLRLVDVPAGDLGYGSDLVCVDDITPDAVELDPDATAGIGQDLYHRLATPRGGLPPDDDKDYGFDLLGALHKGMTTRDLSLLGMQVKAECLKDDRVADADVTITSDANGRSLAVKIVVTPFDPSVGVFVLVLAVTDGAVLLEAIRAGAA
jgi:hypothetical protein